MVMVGRLFFSLVMLCTYPLQSKPCRDCTLSVLHRLLSRLSGEGTALPPVLSKVLYVLVTGIIVCGSFAIVSQTDDLGVVFALIGATGSTMVSYILPAWFYTTLTQRPDTGDEEIEMARTPAPLWSLLDTEAMSHSEHHADYFYPPNNRSVAPWKVWLSKTQLLLGLTLIPLCVTVIVLKEITT